MDEIRDIAIRLVASVYGDGQVKEFTARLDRILENADSDEPLYLFGYMRYFSFYVSQHPTLEEAMAAAESGSDEGYCYAEYVLDPYQKRIYTDPYVYPEKYKEL